MTEPTKKPRGKKPKPPEIAIVAPTPEPEVVSIKGFDQNWTCRGFQYEIGKTYEMDGNIEACERGFHACDADHHPLNVFDYYPPTSKFALVRQSGKLSRRSDSKIASARITIDAEIKLPDLVKRTVEWIMARVTPANGAATNTGDRSAATNTGDRSAATNTGYQSAATNTGDQSAATNTGYQSAATNTGYRSAAMASGWRGQVMGAAGNALFLVHRNDDMEITHAWAGIVGRDGIKPNVFYSLNDQGQPEEIAS